MFNINCFYLCSYIFIYVVNWVKVIGVCFCNSLLEYGILDISVFDEWYE